MKLRRQFFIYLALSCAIVLVATPSVFSSTSATITGRITDQQGLVVPGAQVQATNILTNISYSGETNEDGLYRIPNLPPGEYRVIVQKQGFASIAKPGLEVHVQDIITLNFAMQVGSVAQTITVESGTPLLRTESGSVGTVIQREFMRELPLNGRAFNTLLQLIPGVVIVPESTISPGQFHINGQRGNANYVRVDGVSSNFGVSTTGNPGQTGAGGVQAFNAYGGTSSLVSVDAVEEFRVETSTFAPEFGRAPGGQVSIATRSGTNEFHGGVFDYLRNEKLDANDWFANAAGLKRTPLRQNDFGGFLGGTLLRNRTFFFFSYEGLRLRLPRTTVVQVPSISVRAAAIPSVAPLLNAYPEPNGPVSPGGATAQFTGAFSNEGSSDAISFRLDHTFGSRLNTFGRFSYSPSERRERFVIPSEISSSEVNTLTLTFGGDTTFGSRLTNSFRGNLSTQESIGHSRLDSFGDATPPDPGLLMPTPLRSGIFAPGGLQSYKTGLTASNRERQLNLVDNLAFTSRLHRLEFGADYNQLLLRVGGTLGGFYRPLSLTNFAATGIADLVQTTVVNRSAFRFHFLSLYGQDSWKLNSRLTLVYGLRWEFNPAPSGIDGTTLAAWQSVDDPSRTALAPPGTSLWKSRYDNLAPRVGAAYILTRKGDFVIRGGWGLFYDLGTGTVASLGVTFPNAASRLAFGQTLPLTNVTSLIPVLSTTPPYQSSFVNAFSPNLKLPRSHHWNVALEKSVGGGQVISVAYVGQMGQRLLRLSQESPSPLNPNFVGVFGFILTRNGDSSNYQAMQAQYRNRLGRGSLVLLNYTWSHSIDTSSNDIFFTPSLTVVSAESERGSSSFDVRHNFSAAVLYEVPSLKRHTIFRQITRDWVFGAAAYVRSGLPINVVTFSVFIPGVNAATRPDLVPGQPVWLRDRNAPGGQRLNPAAFSVPQQPRQGTLGRNSISGFGLTQLDLSVGRNFNIAERLKLRFQADFFNIFNHPNFANPDAFVDLGPSSLQSTRMFNRVAPGGLDALYQVGGARSIQLSLKLAF